MSRFHRAWAHHGECAVGCKDSFMQLASWSARCGRCRLQGRPGARCPPSTSPFPLGSAVPSLDSWTANPKSERRYAPATPALPKRHRSCLAVPLRHAHAARMLGLRRARRHDPPPTADDAPAHRTKAGRGRAATGRFPRSPPAGRRVRRPALPRQPRQGTPQPFPLASSPATTNRLRSRSPPLLRGGRALLTGPDPPGSGPARHLRKRHRWFLASTCSSCLPDPDRLAVPARPVVVRVRAAPTLPRVSTVRLPSASPACCDRPAAGPFHPARSW